LVCSSIATIDAGGAEEYWDRRWVITASYDGGAEVALPSCKTWTGCTSLCLGFECNTLWLFLERKRGFCSCRRRTQHKSTTKGINEMVIIKLESSNRIFDKGMKLNLVVVAVGE
jgi:hypothetical protein